MVFDTVARTLTRCVQTSLPTRHGRFSVYGYRSEDGVEHVALVAEPIGQAPLVRVHSECFTGESLASLRCDCAEQLEDALARISVEGGAVIYLRGHEGRGIGLIEKLRAYELQDAGADTVDANLALGHPVDARSYRPAVEILNDLGINRVRLLTNNPDKAASLATAGITVVGIVPVLVNDPSPECTRYLLAKRERLGHLL